MSGRHPDHRSRPDDATYSLEELAGEADVTPRTIRYYISEGLLPPPDSPGRNARYSQGHLDRLRLIAHMKARYLPLKEIRRSLATMSPETIRRQVNRVSGVVASESRRPPEISSANDYLSHVMEEPAPYERPSPRMTQRPPRSRSVDPHRPWRRIPIGDDAELLVTEDAWRRRGDQLESAVDWIRRILNEEKGPRS